MIKTETLSRGRVCCGCRMGVDYVVMVYAKQSGQLMAPCDPCQGRLLEHRDTLEAFVGELLR